MCLHLLHVKVKVLDSEEEVMIFANGHMQVRVTVFNGIQCIWDTLCKFGTHGSLCQKYHGCVDRTQPPG